LQLHVERNASQVISRRRRAPQCREPRCRLVVSVHRDQCDNAAFLSLKVIRLRLELARPIRASTIAWSQAAAPGV